MSEMSEYMVVENDILLDEVGRLLCEGHEVIIMTKGSSMHPFIIGEKDSVALQKRPELNLRDVVLAQVRKGVYVLHRIIAIDGDELTLMGDGNLYGVEKCRRKDVAGTAVAIIKSSGKRCGIPSAKLWLKIKPSLRRYFLAAYRRIFIKFAR